MAWVTPVNFTFSFIILIRTVNIECISREEKLLLHKYIDHIMKAFEKKSEAPRPGGIKISSPGCIDSI